jgi:hypothetical protein
MSDAAEATVAKIVYFGVEGNRIGLYQDAAAA